MFQFLKHNFFFLYSIVFADMVVSSPTIHISRLMCQN